jgi:tetratricopeptide (TPR) repeat protein
LWRDAVARAEGDQAAETREAWTPDEVWVEEPAAEAPGPGTRSRAAPAPRRKTPVSTPREWATGKEGIASPGGHRRKLPRPVVDELEAAAGAARGAKLAHRIADATYAYERERYQEARRTLRILADEVPESATVRELYGLVLYRTGQWAAGAKQLEAFRQMTGSFDQNPVLADCYRALRRYDDAQQVWDDLREASPSGDLVAEGRIVAAGCRADQGDLQGAIALLERSARKVNRPQDRHLRQWYALADLYERAGDVPRARDLFSRIAANEPDAFDVGVRLRSLR